LNGLLSEDLSELDRPLKLATGSFKFNITVSIPNSAFVTIFSILKQFDFIEFGKYEQSWISNFGFQPVFLINTYGSNKVKVILENKIYLHRLIDKLDRK